MAVIAQPQTRQQLEKLLSERILVLDGAMGTMVHSLKLDEAAYRGTRFAAHTRDLKNFIDVLCVTQPAAIESIHRQYLEAGADIIETNTFGATSVAMADFDLVEQVREINLAAVALRRAVDEMSLRTPDKPRFVAGSIGPTNKQLSIAGNVNDPGHRTATFDQMVDTYYEQIDALVEGGVDILLCETAFDTLVMKACLFAIDKFFSDTGLRLPVMASFTVFQGGRTLSAQSVEACWNSISHFDLLSVGINCALGPEMLRPYIEELARIAPVFVSCHPNAGLPNAFGGFDESPEMMARTLGEFAENGWVNIVGGCCGTTPAHIRAIAEAVAGRTPRRRPRIEPLTRLSGLEPLTLRPDSNFLMIGERTNVTGSKKFARLISSDNYDEAVAVAREQVEAGANVIDVNMDEGMLDGEAAMTRFLNLIAAEPEISRVPIMVDSSKWSVIEAGLKCVQGKAIVNSISLKEGEEAFLHYARLVRRYGAAVVVMAFDEQGQATETDRKVEIAERAYRLLTEVVGMPAEDIIFDPNILTVATGIDEHNNYAVNFFEATREIKKRCPGAKISGGVSNVSFSFRGNDVVREAIHSVFLYHAIRAGMDMGIVNAGQLAVYEEIDPALRELVEDVILNRRPDATERLVTFAETVKKQAGVARYGHAGLARRKRAATPGPRAGQGHRRVYRPGRRGSPPAVPTLPRHHRRPADERHADRRRPVRRRQDVFAAGGQKRASDEKGRGLPAPVHGRGEKTSRSAGPADARQGAVGDGQGRRPRHRQEHRRRGARLQQLRGDRPGRDGPLRTDSGDRQEGAGPYDRAVGPDHAQPGRNGVRGRRNGTTGLRTAAVDRRRHNQCQAHRRKDCAGVSQCDRPRAGRFAQRGSRRSAEEWRAASGVRSREPQAAGIAGCLVPDAAAGGTGPLQRSRGQETRHRLEHGAHRYAGVPGHARAGPFLAPAASGIHRLVAVLPDLGAEGQVSGDS